MKTRLGNNMKCWFYKINYIHNYKIVIHKNNTVTGQKQKQLTFSNSSQG